MEGHGERIDTEAVHGHAIDLKLFYSGTYESVKTGGKGNMNGRAFSQAEILDEMRLGEIGDDHDDRGQCCCCSSDWGELE